MVSETEAFEYNEEQELKNQPQLVYDLNVLLVDDNKVNMLVGKLVLEYIGCNVTSAKNGEMAIAKFEEGRFDLVLTDIQMPDMDGIELTQILRKKHKNVPTVIGLSANAMEGDAEKFVEQGLDDYLAKPLTIDLLSDKLSRWFEGVPAEVNLDVNPVLDFVEEIEIVGKENLIAVKDSDKLINWEVISEIEKLLEYSIDELQPVVRESDISIEQYFKNMRLALSENELQNCANEAHAFKGLAQVLGAVVLEEQITHLEFKILNKDSIQELGQKIDDLNDLSNRSLGLIRKRFGMQS